MNCNLCGVGITAKVSCMLKIDEVISVGLSQSGFVFGFSLFYNPITGAHPAQLIKFRVAIKSWL